MQPNNIQKSYKVIIMGAAGRDFHNYNVYFNKKKEYEVVAFTAAQIPFIDENREYKGIPIYPENKLEELIKRYNVSLVVLAYSDLSYDEVMHKASRVLATGANFLLLGPNDTMLKSTKPVISVCAVRTGCGKSMVVRYIYKILKEEGLKPIVIRHPMPYLDFSSKYYEHIRDLKKRDNITIEEREEIEPLLEKSIPICIGSDYKEVLKIAESKGNVIIWDGGNNDFPFIKSNLEIVIVDPLRLGHETTYYPGEINLRRADVIIINKVNNAYENDVSKLEETCKKINPNANIFQFCSKIKIKESPKLLYGKKVLVIEDGPTLTHGNMTHGAAMIFAVDSHTKIVDPKPYAIGTIKRMLEEYSLEVLPAIGYNRLQIKELEKTINNVPCDYIISATPIILTNIMSINKPVIRVSYEVEERVNFKRRVLDLFLNF